MMFDFEKAAMNASKYIFPSVTLKVVISISPNPFGGTYNQMGYKFDVQKIQILHLN